MRPPAPPCLTALPALVLHALQLAACIHAPRASGARGGARRTTSGAAAAAALAAAAAGEQPGTPSTPHSGRGSLGVAGGADSGLAPQWASILRVFDTLLATLRENHVPPFLVQKLFEQLLSFVNVQLFNQLLLRRECCSFSNGEYVKAGLSEVEQWISGAGEEWVSPWGMWHPCLRAGKRMQRACMPTAACTLPRPLSAAPAWPPTSLPSAGLPPGGRVVERTGAHPAGGHLPGHPPEAPQVVPGDHGGPVRRAERAAAVPHLHHVLGRQVRGGGRGAGGQGWAGWW